MENLQVSKENVRSRKVIFVFPGMGKTPYAKTHSGVVDADFGYFREAFGKTKENENTLFKPFGRLLNKLAQDYIVLTNEPGVMRFVKSKDAACILPLNTSYPSRKLGVPETTIREWVAGWDKTAKSLGIPVKYITVGFDKYF